MATEEWKLQVSYKTPTGDLINIRAKTAEELSVMLEGVSDYSTQIAATGKLIQGAYTVAPLATTGSTAGTMQPPTSTTARNWLHPLRQVSQLRLVYTAHEFIAVD